LPVSGLWALGGQWLDHTTTPTEFKKEWFEKVLQDSLLRALAVR
jgi:hypothetical protein